MNNLRRSDSQLNNFEKERLSGEQLREGAIHPTTEENLFSESTAPCTGTNSPTKHTRCVPCKMNNRLSQGTGSSIPPDTPGPRIASALEGLSRCMAQEIMRQLTRLRGTVRVPAEGQAGALETPYRPPQ